MDLTRRQVELPGGKEERAPREEGGGKEGGRKGGEGLMQWGKGGWDSKEYHECENGYT